MKTQLAIQCLILSTIMVLGFLATLKPAHATATYGPRIDQLLYKIYPNSTDEFTAFQTGQIDIDDSPLTSTMVPIIKGNPGYVLDKFRQFSLFEFDLNNNQTVLSYPGIQIPTCDANFRIAMAYMVDKPYIANVIVGGYGVPLDAPIMSWLPWYDPWMTTYSYNSTLACQTLYNNGWRSSPDPNVVINVHFPSTWPTLSGGPNVAGQDLVSVFNKTDVGFGPGSGPGIIFLRRSDDPNRSGAGQLLIYGDATHKGLVSIGIPVDDFNVPRATTLPNVMYKHNFMVYTGSWQLSRNPDYLYDFWYPTAYTPSLFFPPSPLNYESINDPALNAAELAIKLAKDIPAATAACHNFCDRWGQIEPMICLWASAGYYGHRANWHVLNVDSYSVASSWDMLCANNPSIGITGGTLNCGLSSETDSLNVIYSTSDTDWRVLSEIYDTLITYNPLNIGVDMPWMASSWTVGTWNVPSGPNAGGIGSTVTFTLNSGINFVNPVTGTVYAPVTPADVAFSLQYTYGQAGWNSPSLVDCFTNHTNVVWAANSNYQIPFIKATNNTVTVYFQHQSVWAVDSAGNIPIFPKAVFEPITDARGFYPGGDTNVAAMTGSGPFYFSSYSPGVSCLLYANRNYFMPIVPNIDTDPTHIHIDWGLFKSITSSGWKVTVLDLISVATHLGEHGPYGGWIPADVNKDSWVSVLDLITVATDLGAKWDP